MYASDGARQRYPVSIKGVLAVDGRIVLLKNERDEWELPGGKLDPGETPEVCVVREIEEELGLAVECAAILDSWVYDIRPGTSVLIVTYGCRLLKAAAIRISHEHKEVGLFDAGEIDALVMPAGYRRSIRAWLARGA
ncbi:MAG: NUDIX domain-containing protein [Dongiaceae bacterium]